MSNLYDLDDEALLNTNLEELHQEPEQATEATVEQPEQQEQTDGTDVPNETEEATESNTEQTETDTGTTDEVTDTDTQTDIPVDYEAFYKEMTKPFKANGRELSITNADDAVRLMQMGANYSKKMEQLKPKQALLKVLEENHLDNQERLGYLLDLANKRPEAIAKLIKESEIDLYEFDVEQAEGYAPQLTITEPTAFEDTLQELLASNNSMYEVVNHMGTWDSQSKEAIFNEPNILRAVSEQKANGMYDKIVDTIETERMFGRLTNMPYLQAYGIVEQQLMNNANKFTAPRPTNKPDDSNLDKKKKAGLPNGSNAKTQEQFNALSVSDEDLLKMMATL